MIFPFFSVSFSIERSAAALVPEGFFSARAFAFASEPPREEKFQTPEALCRRVTCGVSMVTPVMFSFWEKISGNISTPTCSDLAVRKGEELNLGSSLMERFSADNEPLMSERLKSPSWTLRPSAAEAFASIVGRNWLTGIRNGATRSRTIKTPTTIRAMRSLPFIRTSSAEGKTSGRDVENAMITQPLTLFGDASASESKRTYDQRDRITMEARGCSSDG